MQQPKGNKRGFPKKAMVILALLVSIVAGAISGPARKASHARIAGDEETELLKDSARSVAAFKEVYKVLMHPRCMNCHPAGDVPLQNDDSHLHAMLPRRGNGGHGVYAMKCANCHQPTNTPGLRTPPGNPKWALPPADMKMVFQNKNPRELALQIMDYKSNGHKNKAQLIEHARDTLVKWGWDPGEGRSLPPLNYQEFVAAWDTWINTGGYAPAR
ncbi:MAG: hypothetical protein INR73_14130 [Williamsia sp.]|nr:hypothetical protein [Williamsia sp.]